MFFATDFWNILTSGGFVIDVVVIGAAIFLIYRSTSAKENNELKNDLIDTQRKKIDELADTVKELHDRDDAQQAMIDELKKDLDTWKNLPIRQLADDYHKLAEAVMEMSKVMQMLVKENNGETGLRKRNTKRSS